MFFHAMIQTLSGTSGGQKNSESAWKKANTASIPINQTSFSKIGPCTTTPQRLFHAASKTLETVGKDTIILLSVIAFSTDLTDEMWEAFLHGLPRLELISYRHRGEGENRGIINPFILVFSRLFEGRPVCPKLWCLKLPREALAQEPSCTVLKRALTEREACGMRLRLLGLSGGAREKDDMVMLEAFQGLADMVQ
jgi:hypothetical protein